MSNAYAQTHPHRLLGTQAGRPQYGLQQRLAEFGRAVWKTLETSGRSRAERELLMRADLVQRSQPKLARELRSYVRGGSSY